MRSSPKIVIIGAGSASFGLSVLGALVNEKALNGSHLCLVDVNRDGLASIRKLAEKLNDRCNAGMTISSTTERRELLADADFVILSVAVDREECWQQDMAIAKRYGIMHWAETGGPGALIHTARNLAVIMDILRDMEELCPDAWLLNFTNPVQRICLAATRHSRIRTVGICHQLMYGCMMVGVILAKELGIEVRQDYFFQFDWSGEYMRIALEALEKVDVLAAGINHFTWMLSVRDRRTGEDLYPLLMERSRTHPVEKFEPLNREVAAIFGLFPVSGDCHLCEFLPYTHNMERRAWERYSIQLPPLDRFMQRRAEQWERIGRIISGQEPVDQLRNVYSERAEFIIAAIVQNKHSYEPALNIPNRGYISNLPDGTFVEVPAVVSSAGIHGVAVGALPETIAFLCRRQILVAELAVDAAVTGDRQLALQALALDPMIDDLQVARDLLDDYLTAFKSYLPQFR